MKISALIFLSALGLGASAALGGGVTLTTVGGKTFNKKNGQQVAAGALIRIGTFNLPAATRDATLRATSDYSTLKSWFRPLGESIQGAGTPAQAGVTGSRLRANAFPNAGDVFGIIEDVQVSYMAPGSKLYVWVFDAAAPETSSEWGIFTAAHWIAPQKLGVSALATSGGVEVVQGEEIAGQLRLKVPTSTYGNWAMKKFATENPPAESLFNADPDKDGLHNLAEYAWQLDPNSRNGSLAHLTAMGNASGRPTFEFKAPRALPDVQVIAECSPDLINWSPTTSVITSSDDQFDTHATTSPSGATHLFWRVRFQSVTAAP